MRLPFVSRGRYEDARTENTELKADIRRLHDRIALLSGQLPLYTAPAAPVMTPLIEEETTKVPVKLRPTFATIRHEAETAARERKLGPVVVQETRHV